jgi:hypothetical protein
MKKVIIKSKFSESSNWKEAKSQFHPNIHNMKSINKKILLALAFFIICGSIRGQYFDKAVGGRFGTDLMLTYKQFFLYYPKPQLAYEIMGGIQFDERIFGKKTNFTQTNGFIVQGLCYYHIDLGFDTGFSGFAGLGPFMGIYTPQGEKVRFGGGLAAALGASYSFTHIPLDISIDWMPVLGSPRISLARAGLTLRYILPTPWH